MNPATSLKQPTPNARSKSPYAEEEPWVKNMLEASDRGELRKLTRQEIEAMFASQETKPAK